MEFPRRKHTAFRTERKFEIENDSLLPDKRGNNILNYNIINYNIINYNIINYNIINYNIINYSIIDYNIINYNIIDYNTINYSIINYNIIDYNIINYNIINIIFNYNIISYNIINYNIINYNTINYNIINYNVINYNIINQVTRSSLPDERTKYLYKFLLHQISFVANKIKLIRINLTDNFCSQWISSSCTGGSTTFIHIFQICIYAGMETLVPYPIYNYY